MDHSLDWSMANLFGSSKSINLDACFHFDESHCRVETWGRLNKSTSLVKNDDIFAVTNRVVKNHRRLRL